MEFFSCFANKFVFSFFNRGAYVNAKYENGKMPLHVATKTIMMKSFQPNSSTKLNTTIQTLDTKNVVLQKHNEEYAICLKGHQEHLAVLIEANQ